jgi:glycosyltransferase involved in cell wall biosynthesis
MAAKKVDIFFILTSRFPTEKAYGVTTENTANAAFELGHRTYVLTPIAGTSNLTNLKVIPLASRAAQFFLTRKFQKLLRIRFNFFLLYYSIIIRFKLKNNKSLVWTRDILLCFLLTFFSKHDFILEIHHEPRLVQGFYLKILSKRPNVIISPISNFLSKKFSFSEEKFILSPMSINKSELIDLKKTILRRNQIVYVGSPESSGSKINFVFLNELAFLLYSYSPNWTIEIIGFDKNYFQSQISDRISGNLNFHGLLPRSEVLRKIQLAKIGLVIYQSGNYHQFPIKIVEYAASGLAILASDTASHRRILTSDLCVFYESESVSAAFQGIRSLIEEPDQLNSYVQKLRIWVEYLTYENRVKRILSKL